MNELGMKRLVGYRGPYHAGQSSCEVGIAKHATDDLSLRGPRYESLYESRSNAVDWLDFTGDSEYKFL